MVTSPLRRPGDTRPNPVLERKIMATIAFYNERAAECRRDAGAATLSNVRDRCLGAAAAWDNMADRVRRTDIFRVENDARLHERAVSAD